LLQGYCTKAIDHGMFFTGVATTYWCKLHVGSHNLCLSTVSVLIASHSFYYGTQYFTRAGFDNPFIITVITNSVNVASTFPGLYLVEKMGRRNLLLMGAFG
jgi:hypothetical protein